MKTYTNESGLLRFLNETKHLTSKQYLQKLESLNPKELQNLQTMIDRHGATLLKKLLKR